MLLGVQRAHLKPPQGRDSLGEQGDRAALQVESLSLQACRPLPMRLHKG